MGGKSNVIFRPFMVRLIGLEPTRRKTPDPKSGASTNFATGARRFCFCCCKGTLFLLKNQEKGSFLCSAACFMCRCLPFCNHSKMSLCMPVKWRAAALCFPRGDLSPSKTPPFSVQYAAFWRLKGHLLETKRYRSEHQGVRR